MPETETTITVTVTVDDRTRHAVEAILRERDLTLSQFFSLLMEAIAHDEIFAHLVKETRVRAPPPIIPNAETVAALEAAERGEFSGPFSSVDELMKHLYAGD
jgi:antitoxin component of RelBE/YafQ-DinJ toxin-antitoxin module